MNETGTIEFCRRLLIVLSTFEISFFFALF